MDEHEIDLQLGRNLRRIRKNKGVSQESLGATAGITFQQVQKYEKATNRLAASRLVTFAETLEVDINDFFEGIIK